MREELEGVRGGVGRGKGRSWHRLIITLFGNEQNGCHLKRAIILRILNSQQQYMSVFTTVLCFNKIYRNTKLQNQTKSYTEKSVNDSKQVALLILQKTSKSGCV